MCFSLHNFILPPSRLHACFLKPCSIFYINPKSSKLKQKGRRILLSLNQISQQFTVRRHQLSLNLTTNLIQKDFVKGVDPIELVYR
ncbi:hypothetical protein GQ457_06G025530 [Hibiscus cannabinus]